MQVTGGKIGSALNSRRLALFLFFACAVFAVYGTFVTPEKAEGFFAGWLGRASLPAARALGLVDTYHSAVFIGLLVLLCLNVAWCTLSRFRQPASAPASAWLDLAMHAAVIVVLAGGAVKGWKGFVGTKIIPVGLESATVDDPAGRSDVPLGFTIAVTAQEKLYYPHHVRIGVSRAATGARLRLLELKEGETARVPGEDLEITPGRLDREAGVLALRVGSGGDRADLLVETRDGGRTTAVLGPYALTLVAFRDTLRSVRSRVSIREGEKEVAGGWLEPNGRVGFRGTSLFQTAWGADQFGNPFVGIQVSRDPGAPIFWAGRALFSATLPLYLRHRKKNKDISRAAKGGCRGFDPAAWPTFAVVLIKGVPVEPLPLALVRLA